MTTPSADEIRSKVCALAFGNPVIQNDFRGILAEVIIGTALGNQWQWCSGDWGGWDFEHLDKTRLEVKAIGRPTDVGCSEESSAAEVRYPFPNRLLRRRGMER